LETGEFDHCDPVFRQITGLEMPAAVVLWSPWFDLTGSGDTYFTLKNEDLFLSYG
jgi:acetyl esterase/lipase